MKDNQIQIVSPLAVIVLQNTVLKLVHRDWLLGQPLWVCFRIPLSPKVFLNFMCKRIGQHCCCTLCCNIADILRIYVVTVLWCDVLIEFSFIIHFDHLVLEINAQCNMLKTGV